MARKFLVCALLAGLLFACAKSEKDGGNGEMPRIDGKRVLMIIAYQNFRDEELLQPKGLLEKQGATVTLASSQLGVASGMLGAKATVDILVKDVKVSDYNAVIFVGGSGADEYWDDATAQAIVTETVNTGKLLCAICIAPVTLAKAGVLKGKRATVFSSERGKLEAEGAIYTGKNVEVDGKIITANGPNAAAEFARAIMKALQ
ncbi:DJ-1/PfpI family protein [Candidatus Poribacteria bacterium]|nr:DJ-1/PfpI family protein [Candidatus Poribacteria bacterium]